jgi:citrate synthase
VSTAANTVALNGQDFEVMPLNWKQLKEYRAQIILLNGLNPTKGMFSEEEQDAILKVITASLKRRRNDIGEEFVAEHLDLGNVGNILRMCFGQKPLSDKDAPVAPGEAQAASSKT